MAVWATIDFSSSGKTVIVWRVADGSPVLDLELGYGVSALAFAPGGQMTIASRTVTSGWASLIELLSGRQLLQVESTVNAFQGHRIEPAGGCAF